MTRTGFTIAASLAARLFWSVGAAHAATCDGQAEACAQLDDLLAHYVGRYNKRDAAGVAALFAEDAVQIDPGDKFSGRADIEKSYADDFKDGWSGMSMSAETLHAAGDVAWGDGMWTDSPPATNDGARQVKGTWGAVFGRKGGEWKLQMIVTTVDPGAE